MKLRTMLKMAGWTAFTVACVLGINACATFIDSTSHVEDKGEQRLRLLAVQGQRLRARQDAQYVEQTQREIRMRALERAYRAQVEFERWQAKDLLEREAGR